MTSSSPAPDRSLHRLALGALLCGLQALAPAAAQEPVQPEPVSEPASEPTDAPPPQGEEPTAGEVITVYGDQEVQRRRMELEATIRDYGYQDGKRKDDKTIFRPEVPWKPSIIVHDEGYMELKRSPVRWMVPGRQDNALNYLWCLPPFTPMCVRIGGQVVSGAKLTPQKGKVLDEIHEPSEAWRGAIVDRATWARVNDEVPKLIEATWQTGAPVEGSGPALADRPARRKALLAFWASRSDTPEGHMVAQVVEDFILYEVQTSAWPATPEELAAANAAADGVRALPLPASPDPSPSPPDGDGALPDATDAALPEDPATDPG